MGYRIAWVSETGNRRKTNQDRWLALAEKRDGKAYALLAVADGMGGLKQGDLASEKAVELLRQWWRTVGSQQAAEQCSDALDEVIYEIHRQLFYLSQQQGAALGTTLSVLVLAGKNYLFKQVGDSRIYLRVKGNTTLLTTDQTWCNEAIAQGLLAPEQAENHWMRHALVNALGASEELKIDTGSGTVPNGACFLLCSDGFYNGLPAPLESYTWANQKELDRLSEEILKGSAPDNLTAVLCRVSLYLQGGRSIT